MLRLRKIIYSIPFIGDTNLQDHKEAVIELLLILCLSFFPLILTVFGDYLLDVNFSSASNSLFNNISNGELFIYVAALIAPLFYTIVRRRPEEKRFPYLTLCMWVYIFLIGLVAFAFAMQRAANPIPENMLKASLGIFAVTLFLNYTVLVYNNHILFPNAPKKMRDEEEDFVNRLEKHRGPN